MLKRNRVSKDDAEFDLAIFYKSKVTVIQQAEVIGFGVVQSFTEDTVTMEDGTYPRLRCQFKIAKEAQ